MGDAKDSYVENRAEIPLPFLQMEACMLAPYALPRYDNDSPSTHFEVSDKLGYTLPQMVR